MRVLCVIGTRPEVIKMAPIIKAFKKEPSIEVTTLSLGQHRELLDQMLDVFGIIPQKDLNIMRPNQSLPALTAALPIPLDEVLEELKPDVVIAQGDTTSTLMTSLACAYRRIPFGHVEAGLRTYNFDHPFPEEMNRVLISRLAALHFAPTEQARVQLLEEGIEPGSIFVTGNPVIDALHSILKKKPQLPFDLPKDKRIVLLTLHRREAFARLELICHAVRKIVDDNKDVVVVCPVHPNPNVRGVLHAQLGGHERILLKEPLGYVDFIALMQQAYLILSDSGGVQEEAPALGVPVLVLRHYTERMEAVKAGFCKLVGTDPHKIGAAAQEILDDPKLRAQMVARESPFGDGHAAERIVKIVIGSVSLPNN